MTQDPGRRSPRDLPLLVMAGRNVPQNSRYAEFKGEQKALDAKQGFEPPSAQERDRERPNVTFSVWVHFQCWRSANAAGPAAMPVAISGAPESQWSDKWLELD
ncbi:hypothetical protein ColLi_02695 [Colletotrichum liriopes]|uniref:Uncharacterized protein n=1 Tax=Colletotrichum liriopes TaxID=708192 RepID=A0AA37LPZ5_9PEZI|nr:hypothetical protein ColLi_02695 [Colletotrichum liriopes]